MIKLGGYSIGIAQIDDEIEEKNQIFEFTQILLSTYWSVGLTCLTSDVFLLVA